MLLYTKLATPKVPKKRSRAGCNYCKEKKKKCDETRPQCSRCQERGQDCMYEPIKPRQRRKRTSMSLDTQSGAMAGSTRATQKPCSAGDASSATQWQQDFQATYGRMQDDMFMRNDERMSTKAFDDMDAGYNPWTPGTSTAFSPIITPVFPLHNNGDQTVIMGDGDIDEVVRCQSFIPPYSPSSLVPYRGEPTLHLEFCLPMFSEFSPNKNRRVLIDHFCNVLSHLIVLREENGNPFQQLVLPLCYTSPAVMDAVYALASAHLEHRGVETGETSDFFHGQAIQALARLIEQGGGVRRNELLAAIMLIVYYEVLVQKGRSNLIDTHLKGAMTILNNVDDQKDPTGEFLERAFRFYDVIAALSLGTAPLSSAPGRGSLSPLPPLDSRGAASPVGSVDTLLGMATTLWPIIHRLSNLAGVKDDLDVAVRLGQSTKAAVLRTELETTASAIQVALKQWQPILPPGFYYSRETTTVYMLDDEEQSADTTVEHAQLRGVLNNSLAYRHSAFVYLYRTIKNYPRDHPLVQQHAHASLSHCVGTVRSDGPMSALLWPLFVAACEAGQAGGDRGLARQVFVAIDRRQGMANIERAWCIVQEVWRRADEAELTTLQEEEEEEEEEGEGEDDNVDDAGKGPSILNGLFTSVEKSTADGMLGLSSWHTGHEGEVSSKPPEKRISGGQLRRKGGDLWRRVSRDMGVTIVFG